MKHLIGIVLVIVMLTGCAAGVTSVETTAPTRETVTETIPEGTQPTSPALESTYVPQSAIERQTNGAVRMYCPDVEAYTELVIWGEDLLVLSGKDTTMLTLLEGETLAVAARRKLDCRITAENGGVQVGKTGIAYFCNSEKCIVFTDQYLNETRRLVLPADMTGRAVVSPDGCAVYYCTNAGVYVIDLRTGISRLLREQTAAVQTVTGIYFDGSVLGCYIRQEDEAGRHVYISAQTGETLHANNSLDRLYTAGELYCSQMKDGSMELCLAGNGGREMQRLAVPEGSALIPVLACGGVVLRTGEDKLSFVELSEGSCTAELCTEGLTELQVLGADSESIWFAAWSEKVDTRCLFRWNPAQSESEDSGCYLVPYYPADKPDLTGLQKCKDLARNLGEKYGIKILLWDDTLVYQPWDYTFEPEYRVEIYQRDLAVLEQALQKFPAGFFREAASGSDSGNLTICLVRSLKDGEILGESENACGAQYWLEDSAYIALALGQSMESTFYHEMSHLIDSRVICTSKAYDDWESLNPWEFDYDYDYEENLNREDEGYLEDENRLFIDIYSMSFPKEDRARILEYAMMPGNESYFSSEQMQAKLQTICTALREVFDLDPEQHYAWEQYLAES